MATATNSSNDMKQFTDCMYFINGNCKWNDKCRFRHCAAAQSQLNKCHKWPKICRNIQCPYRHPAPPQKPKPPSTTVPKLMATHSTGFGATGTTTTHSVIPKATAPVDASISFFWDIENVPIPRGQKPFDIVQRIREKLVVGTNLREISFSCFCNTTTISSENQLSLHHANVRIVHVPDRKPGAVDRQIMLELDRFERAHRPPATIVLISGDIDFVGKLSDLRHQAGFHVIVIHNKPAKSELKSTVNAHFPWEAFTQSPTNNSGPFRSAPPQVETMTSNQTTAPKRPPSANVPRNDQNNHRQRDSSARSTTTRNTRKSMEKCPKCSNEFESIQALRQHQEAKSHIFECPGCDEEFFTADGLCQHQKAKDHFDPVFICQQCRQQFLTGQSLNQHRQATGHFDPNDYAILRSDCRSVVPSQVATASLSPDEVIFRGIQTLAATLPKIFK